jgi:phosphate/sulfate permease
MESIFIFIVVIMFALAITDLVVGVSNDAVNFLTSAIGSKAATFRQIMIIASIGIMFGAVFSSGMMEVARKGVFNPQFFTIEEIMFLFAAVMITDIILLDFYNTIALPTSTTVSIVFELLGSALAVSFFSVLGNGHTISEWGNYINGDRAIIIVVGIFLSVVVAFALGWLVQYITRLIVSFDYQKSMRTFGSLFGSASVALIIVFIVLKGLQGIPFISAEALDFLKQKAGWVALAGFAIAFVSFQVFIGRKDFSVYKFVTLLGTFALAMAFASNDLVNFVGVPIASYDSYMIWKDSGVAAQEFKMTSLAEPVKTKTIFLFGAGIVMTLTLWFSRKARSVVKTSVNLGRQDEGAERFAANEFSRGIVKTAMGLSRFVNRLIPDESLKKLDKRFVDTTVNQHKDKSHRPAFDMVRASVNLIVAAGIILVATSMKLPLSTTFVSFMVLMGTSLADKAWAQGSAVYRISGVFAVIGGWFLTAIIALTVSIIFASLLMIFKGYALAALVILAVLMIFRSQIFYQHHRYKAEVSLELADKWFKSDFMDIEFEVRQKLMKILDRIDNAYDHVIEALIAYDRKALKEYLVRLEDAESTNDLYKVKITQQIKDVPEQYREGGKILMFVYDLENELLTSLSKIIRSCERHVSNLHPKIELEQVEILMAVKGDIKTFMDQILLRLNEDLITDQGYQNFKLERKGLIKKIEQGVSEQIKLATTRNLSGKNSELILTILFSNKDIVITCSHLVKLFYKIKSLDYSNDMLDQLLEEI